MTEHYGEEWRSWPGGCAYHGEGNGYFTDYRKLFASAFAVLAVPDPSATYDLIERQLLCVAQAEGGWWHWEHGWFSWTPYGDIYDCYSHSGINATRARAVAECERSAATFIRRAIEWRAEYREREKARLP